MVLWKSLSCVQLFATPWTRQSMEFSRQEYWSGLPLPSPGDLPNPGIKPRSPALLEGSLPAEPPGKPKNTRVGGLSLLQQIFPAQESHWGLLHCSQEQFFTSWDTREPPCQCEGHKSCKFDPWVRKNLLEEEMATYSSILAWKIPWTEEPGSLSPWGQENQTWLSDKPHTNTRKRGITLRSLFKSENQL